MKDPAYIDNDDHGIAHYAHISKYVMQLAIPRFDSCDIFQLDKHDCHSANTLNHARPIAIHSVGKGCH